MDGLCNLLAIIIWPLTIFILLFVFRKQLKSIINILEHRIKEGDSFSAFGVSLEKQIKETREEIYAKIETVKRLGEEFAEISTTSLTRIGKAVGPPTAEEMEIHRNRLEKLLLELGADHEKLNMVTESFNASIKEMLIWRILEVVQKKLADEKFTPIERRDVPKEFREILQNAVGQSMNEHLVAYLEPKRLLDKEMELLLKQYSRFSIKGYL